MLTVAIDISVKDSMCFLSDEADKSEMLGPEYYNGATVGYSDVPRADSAAERKVSISTMFPFSFVESTRANIIHAVHGVGVIAQNIVVFVLLYCSIR